VNTDPDSIGTLNWASVPVFGVCAGRIRSVIRPSAYGLIRNVDGRLALAHNPHGTFLPGGGIETGETPVATIAREALEECGLVARLGTRAVYAVQFAYAEVEQIHFEKRSIFIDGVCERWGLRPTEPEYELLWVDSETAIRVLSPESHRWAVGQATDPAQCH
jgi:8-oxo-dGTP diphosphatase